MDSIGYKQVKKRGNFWEDFRYAFVDGAKTIFVICKHCDVLYTYRGGESGTKKIYHIIKMIAILSIQNLLKIKISYLCNVLLRKNKECPS